MDTKELLRDDFQKKIFTSMRKEFIGKSIKIDALEEYVYNGWEVIKKTSKKALIRKAKSTKEVGFNRVCVSLYNLGFKILINEKNNLENFRHDQFAFEAVDDEVVLLVYYFYSEREKTINQCAYKIRNRKET